MDKLIIMDGCETRLASIKRAWPLPSQLLTQSHAPRVRTVRHEVCSACGVDEMDAVTDGYVLHGGRQPTAV